MKSLKFNHIEAENIIRGKQTATLRMYDDKNLSVNDVFEVIDKVKEDDKATWKVIGLATITRITEHKISQLEIGKGNFERYGSMTELYEQMALFYGDVIDDSTPIKVIEFEFVPDINQRNLTEKVEKNTTKIYEIKLYGDGGSRGNPGPSASGYVIMDMQNNIIETNGEYLNIATNNQAEYHSLRLGLERAKQLGVENVHVYMDSMLVINQMKGIFKVKNADLRIVYREVTKLASIFNSIEFTHVPRELNKLADSEVNRILDANTNIV
mgnify:CR=1 FL=1